LPCAHSDAMTVFHPIKIYLMMVPEYPVDDESQCTGRDFKQCK
jgi:hypothetical protein